MLTILFRGHCSGVVQLLHQWWLKDISLTGVTFFFSPTESNFPASGTIVAFCLKGDSSTGNPTLSSYQKWNRVTTQGHRQQAVGPSLLSAIIYDLSTAWQQEVILSLIRLMSEGSYYCYSDHHSLTNPSSWCQFIIICSMLTCSPLSRTSKVQILTVCLYNFQVYHHLLSARESLRGTPAAGVKHARGH